MEYFDIKNQSSSSGQFFLINKKPLLLPNYPSNIRDTLLYLTVNCNNKNFPLFTVRIHHSNSHKPQFYNEPYEVVVLKVVIKNFQQLNTSIYIF